MSTDFSDRPGAALVVGGSGGIGRAIVRMLGERGSAVVATYRSSAAKAQLAVDEATAYGVRGSTLPLDTDDAELWLVEWPERGVGALPPPDLTLALAMDGKGRSAILTPGTPAGQAWRVRLLADSGLKPFLAAS